MFFWLQKEELILSFLLGLLPMHTNARKEKISAYIGKWTFVHFSNAE